MTLSSLFYWGGDATTVTNGSTLVPALGANFYSQSVASQQNILVHELIHAFTTWDDPTVFSKFRNAGLQQYNPGSGDISAWIGTDCKFTPHQTQ